MNKYETNKEVDLTSSNDPEKKLFLDVIARTISKKSHRHVYPQYEIREENGKIRRIDFALITDKTKLAIELDGYTYHAEGKVTQEKFSSDLTRQNEMVLAGWKVIRFSWLQVSSNPELCRNTLRRAIIADDILHPSLSKDELSPHDIQREALNRLQNSRKNGINKGLVVMATGLGKTFLAAFDAKKVGGRILFIVHNNSILEQAKEAFNLIMPEQTKGFFYGCEKNTDADIVFANICSLRSGNNLSRFNNNEFDYIVVDEFHHSATDNYKKVLLYFKPKFLLGLTATPDRTDEKSILSLVSNNLVYRVTQHEAIEKGFLSPFMYHAFRDNVDYTNIKHNGLKYDLSDLNKHLIIEERDKIIVDKYRSITNEAKSIGFCVSIEHAKRAALRFSDFGIPSVAIHSKMNAETRRELVRDFANNVYKIVFVRDIFNEGVDFPDVEALIFMRPTESKIIFMQQLGRGLRISSGKTSVKVLDFIGNYQNVDRVIDYLGEIAGSLDQDKLVGGKPVYYHDTGCEIIFEQTAVDIITSANKPYLTDGMIIDDFYRVYERIGSYPSFYDIQVYGKYKIADYLQHYGCWDDFLSRIERIDPDAPAKLKWPSHLSFTNINDFADLLDEGANSLSEYFEDLGNCYDEILNNFRKVTRLARHDHIVEINSRLISGFKALSCVLDQLIIIFSFRFESPNMLLVIDDCFLISSDEVSRVEKKFTLLFNVEASYIFPRLLAKSAENFCKLMKISEMIYEDQDIDELMLLETIYYYILRCHRDSSSILSYLREIEQDYL